MAEQTTTISPTDTLSSADDLDVFSDPAGLRAAMRSSIVSMTGSIGLVLDGEAIIGAWESRDEDLTTTSTAVSVDARAWIEALVAAQAPVLDQPFAWRITREGIEALPTAGLAEADRATVVRQALEAAASGSAFKVGACLCVLVAGVWHVNSEWDLQLEQMEYALELINDALGNPDSGHAQAWTGDAPTVTEAYESLYVEMAAGVPFYEARDLGKLKFHFVGAVPEAWN